MMHFTYLGQAGLLLETLNCTVMIDPYLSDSVGRMNPACHRRIPVDEHFLTVKPNVLVFTHDHLDHYDPETVSHFLGNDTRITVLSPVSVWQKVRQIGGENNYVLFNRGTEWTEFDLRFTAVFAAHSDPHAIGVLITDIESGKNFYITGDSLYNRAVIADLPEEIHTVFLPVNGVGNNMNMRDAARFVEHIAAKNVVPLHIGMFDSLSAVDFPCVNKVIPTLYSEIPLGD